MRVHIWIDKKDVQGMAKGTDKIIDFWYRKPSFPNKQNRETVMVSISSEEFQLLLDNQEVDDNVDDIMIDQGFGD
jgi:hypothetical protein